jgi:hypothetical protein
MSARINGITNTNIDVNIENNMKVLPLVREEYYLTLEAFNKLELTKDISFIGNDISFNANISISGDLIPLYNTTSDLGSSSNYWSNAYINNLNVNNFVNTIDASNLTDNTITSAKIASNTIVDDDISLNANILFSKINTTNAIMDSDISSNANISGYKIADASIASTKIDSSETWSFTNISISGDLVPLNPISSDLGSSTNYWSNAYIRDISISNISVSGSINIPNGSIVTNDISDLSITTDKIARDAITNEKIAHNAVGNNNIQEHAVTQAKIAHYTIQAININTSAPGTWTFRNISGTYMTISGNIIPLNNVVSDLGSSSNYWRHAYIENIDVSSHIRIGQGHFGGKILPTSSEHEIIIDPHGFDFPYTGNDASGRVVILGDLIVRGDTTTINSATIDISDLILNIASNATRNNVFGIESGIELGSDKYASLLYNRVSNSWKTNIGLEISGAITLSGNLISSSNNSQLGSSNNYWSNAYITNLNVTNFVNTIDASYLTDNTITSAKIANGTIVNNDISSNAQIEFSKIDASNAIMNSDISTNASIAFSKIDASLAITNSHIATNADISGSKIANTSIASSKIDSSGTWRFLNISANFGNIYDLSVNNAMTISGNLIPLNSNNNSTLGSTTNLWRNAYIQTITASNINISGSISVSDNIVPLNSNNNSNLGLTTIRWNNLFVRNIDVSGDISNVRQIIPQIANDIITSLGTSSNIWQRAFISDLSGITRINGETWPLTSGGGGGGGTSDFSGLDINTSLIPRDTTSIDLGSSSKYWRNAYIQDLSASNIYSKTEVDTSLLNVLNTNHYTKQYGNNLWNKIGQDLSFATTNALFGISNNGRVVGLTVPAFNSNIGRLYVYEISFNGTSYSWETLGVSSEIMVGQTTTDLFGGTGNSELAFSSDGKIVAVSATHNDTCGNNTGQISVFELSANVWRLRGQPINGKPIASYQLGFNVALSGNGNILAAASRDYNEILAYEFSGNSWIQRGQDISSGSTYTDQVGWTAIGGYVLGWACALSLDGTTIVAGQGAMNNSTIYYTGRVNIYRYNNTTRLWNNIGTINGLYNRQYFGWHVSISSDGNTIAVGSRYSNGVSNPPILYDSGSIIVYKYNGGTSWTQIGQTIFGTAINDTLQGVWVSISNDGTIISFSTNLSIKVYKLYNNNWYQIGQSIARIFDKFGGQLLACVLSGDGTTFIHTQYLSSTNNRCSVYGMDKVLAFNELFASSLTISGSLSVNAIRSTTSSTIISSASIHPIDNGISCDLGSTTRLWRNAYIQDISARNISVSGNIVPLNSNNNSNLGLTTLRWNNLFVRNIDVSGDISNVRDICNVRQIIPRPTSDISTSLGTSSNIWQKAFISDLSGITSINGAAWPLTSGGGGGGTSDFSGTNIITSLIPRDTSSVDLGSSSKLWRNAYIQTISATHMSISGNLIPLGYDFTWQLMGSEINGEAQNDRSGFSVSLNNDGNIVAIGARLNDGNGSNSGHTRVYKYDSYDDRWIRLGQDIDGDGSNVSSGTAVSLNSSGNNVAILSTSSTSIYKYNDISWVRMDVPITSASGNSAVSLNSIGNIVAICNTITNSNRGDIRVYKFNDISWVPLGQTLIGEEQFKLFGFSISLNAAGNIVAAGARDGGYVKIYSYNDISWVPIGQTLIEEAVSDRFGFSVSLNDTGNIIAIGAPNNDGNGANTGHVRVYKYDTIDFLWKPLGLDIDGLASELGFGSSVSLNSIGNIVAIGGSIKPYGYTKVYYYNDITWEPMGITISGEATGDTDNAAQASGAYSGHSVSLNSTGNIVAIGAPLNDGDGYIDDAAGGNGFNIGSVRIYNLRSKTNSDIGSSANYWKNAYIENSYVETITAAHIGGNLVPLYSTNESTLGSTTNMWQKAFISNLSVGNISISGNIMPNLNEASEYQNIGNSTNSWNSIHSRFITVSQLLSVNGQNVSSDDRIKYNEIIINNGLIVIDQLCPKFYQKTIEMLAANFNGDLNGYKWRYEAGLIAQELLQISDISYVVSGGDTYDSNNNLKPELYGVNYNSIFVYGLAAIKELHQKVKAQESIILNLQNIVNSLLTRIQALENKP